MVRPLAVRYDGCPVPSREILPDGAVRLRGERSEFTIKRLCHGVVLVTIAGNDVGDLGITPLQEVEAEILVRRPIELFVDTREATAVVTRVREQWTAWFKAHERDLTRIDVLVSSRFFTLTVSVAKMLSDTGELIRIHSDPQAFAAAIDRSVAGLLGRA
jgi:hypothetical protein